MKCPEFSKITTSTASPTGLVLTFPACADLNLFRNTGTNESLVYFVTCGVIYDRLAGVIKNM